MTLLKKVIEEEDGFVGYLEDQIESQVNLVNRELYPIVIHFPYRLLPKHNKKTKETAFREAQDKARSDKQHFYYIPGDLHLSIDKNFESAVVFVSCYRFKEKIAKNEDKTS